MSKQHVKYNVKQRGRAYFTKRSQLYRQQGFRRAKPLTRAKEEFEDHGYSYMVDLCVALTPALLWVFVFILIICGILPVILLTPMYWITLVLLLITSFGLTGWFSLRSHGLSFGRFLTGLKVVHKSNKEAAPLILLLREIIEVGIPICVLGYLFNMFGILAFWIVNTIVTIISPGQRTIADWILGTRLIYEPQMNIRFEQDVKKELEVTPIDLHIHSNFSDDGYYSVEDLFVKAKEAGCQTISITDHNCVRANTQAKRLSVLYGVHYVPGIEIDCSYRGRRLRVLGYYIDERNELFDAVESESLKREKAASLLRAKKLKEYAGIVVDMERLLENTRFQNVSGKQIAKIIFDNEAYRQFPLIQHYLESSSNDEKAIQHFARDMFEEGGPCYVELTYPSLHDILEIVHLADGIAVLSSWGCDQLETPFIEQILMEGFDGVEAFSPMIKKETMARLLKLAKEHKLLISAGSDFHGPTHPNRYMGVTNCPKQAWPLVEILTSADANNAKEGM